ncbi:sensor histidine kinase [Cystobacter fuscus]|nr:HAMP domain-containing sensor histidine kinase [Cystobacter fuscus]
MHMRSVDEGLTPGVLEAETRAREARLADEQRLFYAASLTWVLFWSADMLSVLRPTWDTLALRCVWAGLTVLSGRSLPRAGPVRRSMLRILSGVILPNVFFGLIIYRLGGLNSPIFHWLCLMPAVSLLMGRGLWHGAVSTLLMLMVAGSMLWAGGAPKERFLSWIPMLIVESVGIQLTFFYQRLLLERAKAAAEQKLARRALDESNERALRAEQMAQLGQLAAGVAHEVRNPLAYIQANLRFLQEEARPTGDASDSEYAAALQETMHGVERIHQIVRDLTALSRSEQPEPVSPCDLGPVIDTSVRLASVRLKTLVRLAVEVPETPRARAEPRRLGQVLLNLLLNAADAIEEAKVSDGRVALRVQVDEERVRVLVEDNGPGIRAEHLSRLFTSFFTTKAPGKGTGLGLALSRQYVESFGGTLRAENRSEGGARFIVELPAA